MKAVFDTNILIDYLKGIKEAADEIDRFDERTISVITYVEVLVGIDNKEIIESVKTFLNSFIIVPVNMKIADLSVGVRKRYKLKVPDAIIFATAQSMDALLVTRNTKDFSLDIPIVRMPYKIMH